MDSDTEDLRCYITNKVNQGRFIREARKRFVTDVPVIEGPWILFTGPRTEIERLRLFYEGIVFSVRDLL